MIRPSELDRAQLRHEMRQLYSHLGFEGSLQVFYELLVGAEIMAEVITEEREKENHE